MSEAFMSRSAHVYSLFENIINLITRTTPIIQITTWIFKVKNGLAFRQEVFFTLDIFLHFLLVYIICFELHALQ